MNEGILRKRKYYLSKGEVVLCLMAMALLSSLLLYTKVGQQVPFYLIFSVKVLVWLFWGIWIPLIFFLSKKVPIQAKNYYLGLLLHIPISTLIVSIHLLLYTLAITLSPIAGFQNQSFWPVFSGFFFSQFEWYYMTYWALLLGSYAVTHYQNFREADLKSAQLEMRLTKAHLKALKMQLHPHFLFNTLNTISSLIRQNEQQKSITMISELGSLLRMVLQQHEVQFVTLSHELNFIRKYIVLEEKRFEDKIKSRIDYEETIAQALIPSFILQPLVENSIYHGLSKKLDAKELAISAHVVANRLIITIYNEGFSLPENFDIAKVKGIGLANTIERLNQLFPDDYEINLLNERKGVLVKLDIPYESKENNHRFGR